MKPHIEQTLQELRGIRTRLDENICFLEGLAGLDDGTRQPPAITTTATVSTSIEVPKLRRGRPAGRAARQDTPPDSRSANRNAVRSIMAACTEPFTQEDLRKLLETQRRDLTNKQVNDLVRNTVHALVALGEIGEVGEGRPTKYKRRPQFQTPGGAEDRYRQFRSTVPTSTPESA